MSVSKFELKERCTSYHSIKPLGKDGAPVTPEGIRYRVIGLDDIELVPWTSISTSATEIVISSDVNTISSTNGSRRCLTVEVVHDGGKMISDFVEYELIRLKGKTL